MTKNGDHRALVTYDAAAPVTLFGSNNATEIIRAASEKATALAEVIRKQKLSVGISGQEHVKVEGWSLLGTLLGVFPITVWTRETEKGWEARVEARTLHGDVVGAAEAECSRDESLWKNRASHALRSMAQTRATSKALRMPLGFVMSLAGFNPTPLEEMENESQRAPRAATTRSAPRSAPQPIGTPQGEMASASLDERRTPQTIEGEARPIATGPSDAASVQQRAYIERLLSDCSMDYDALCAEIGDLPTWDALTVGSVPRAVDYLLKVKKQAAGSTA